MNSYFTEHYRNDQYGRQHLGLAKCRKKHAYPGFPDCEGYGDSAICVEAPRRIGLKEFRKLFSSATFQDGIAIVRGIKISYGNFA